MRRFDVLLSGDHCGSLLHTQQLNTVNGVPMLSINRFEHLSFGSNIRPSEVTPEVRTRLIGHWLRRLPLVILVELVVLVTLIFVIALVVPNIVPVLIIMFILAVSAWHYREFKLLKHGAVTKGVVIDTQRSRGDEGTDIIKVVYQFLPIQNVTDEDLFRKDLPRLRGQESLDMSTRSFGGRVRPGHLISVIYDRRNPKRSIIVKELRIETSGSPAGVPATSPTSHDSEIRDRPVGVAILSIGIGLNSLVYFTATLMGLVFLFWITYREEAQEMPFMAFFLASLL